MKGEISYDLIMLDDMSFVEGTFRIEGGEWQVFIFSKDSIKERNVSPGHWDSGVTGFFIRVPLTMRLNTQTVEQMMTDQVEVNQWQVVRGPDSMRLR